MNEHQKLKWICDEIGYSISSDIYIDCDGFYRISLSTEFGVDIVGLTKESVFKLLDFIEPLFSKEVAKRLFQ